MVGNIADCRGPGDNIDPPRCPPGFTETMAYARNLGLFFRKQTTQEHFVAIEFGANYHRDIVRDISREISLLHCVDPFKDDFVTGWMSF